MQGSYESPLVLLSILIATLASYVALEFAGRIFARPEQRTRWLAAGALAMGSGIWAMHFVGMSAFTLPVAITYDALITLGSWVAAVAVSALALWLVSAGRLTAVKVAAGALAMGAGICVMHYSGMWAMRMSPGIHYDPFWFTVSVLIAVGASAAALVIVAKLRVVRRWADIGLRIGAASVMGLAVAGMHYSGMAAARFDPAAMCLASNTLDADALATPTVIASLLGLGVALFFAIDDARALIRAKREVRAEAVRVATLAFTDRETGLPNRAWFTQAVVQAWAKSPKLAVVALRIVASGRALESDQVSNMAAAVRGGLAEVEALARTSTDQLMVLVPGVDEREIATRIVPTIERATEKFRVLGFALRIGVAVGPQDAANVQALILRASSRASAEGASPSDSDTMPSPATASSPSRATRTA